MNKWQKGKYAGIFFCSVFLLFVVGVGFQYKELKTNKQYQITKLKHFGLANCLGIYNAEAESIYEKIYRIKQAIIIDATMREEMNKYILQTKSKKLQDFCDGSRGCILYHCMVWYKEHRDITEKAEQIIAKHFKSSKMH